MKPLRIAALTSALVAAAVIGVGTYLAAATETDIDAFQERIAGIGADTPSLAFEPGTQALGSLPAPVQRYFRFVFRGQVPAHQTVHLAAQGRFRRPLTDSFNPMTAEQVIAVGTPALMFSAETTVLPGIWARAYDYFANGQMEMKAKILSSITVVNESETPELNRISLRRWLLESALFPQALLPGGPVSWEPINDDSARAIVRADGLSAEMIAHFDASGRMTHMTAEQDGDLTTPYHGSGEHVARRDYRQIDGQMIPHGFTISRAANGKLYPFIEGQITEIRFEASNARGE